MDQNANAGSQSGPQSRPFRVAVIGAGSWGTAVACHVARSRPTVLWARDPAQRDAMRAARSNARYLPDAPFPDQLDVADTTAECVDFAGRDGLIIVASPTAGLRVAFRELAGLVAADGAALVWLAKGLEAGTGKLAHQLAAETLVGVPHGVVSGPSFAQEVAAGLPAALVVAATGQLVSERVVQAFHHHSLRIYFSEDMTGIELGGAMKNVIAIAAGICDGLKLGANARAALMTRGLAELARLGQAMGGRAETFMGLAGMGDLVLTCTTDLSRNRRVGLRLANGESLQTIVQTLGHVAEGVPCAAEAVRRARQLGVDMPIANAVCDVIDGRQSARAAVTDLLSRDAVAE